VSIALRARRLCAQLRVLRDSLRARRAVQIEVDAVPSMAPLPEVELEDADGEVEDAEEVDVYAAPGVHFMIFRRWDVSAAKFVACGKAEDGASSDNRHALYERAVGFRRHNQERIDRSEATRAMYEELRNDPAKAAAYNQRVEGFSLFERFVLERRPTDEYAVYLGKLANLESESDGPIAFQIPPEDLVVAWSLNLRKDVKNPFAPGFEVDHVYGTIKTYLSRISGTVKEFCGKDASSPSNCAILREKLAIWKKADGEEQSATFDNLPEDLKKLYDACFEGKQRWSPLQRVTVWSMWLTQFAIAGVIA
jgi:hypothetical protein